MCLRNFQAKRFYNQHLQGIQTKTFLVAIERLFEGPMKHVNALIERLFERP
jgi:hypothetical protein